MQSYNSFHVSRTFFSQAKYVLLLLKVLFSKSTFFKNLFLFLTTFVFILGCSYFPAIKAFLFSLYNVKGYNPVKLTQYQNQQNAMYRCSSRGPTFGSGHDIYISDNALSNQNSYTNCGNTYSVPSGYSAGNCGFFTGGFHFTPTDIEVFYEIGN